MKFYRYMSEKEFNDLKAGKKLKNNSSHEGFYTDSVGFCFFREDLRVLPSRRTIGDLYLQLKEEGLDPEKLVASLDESIEDSAIKAWNSLEFLRGLVPPKGYLVEFDPDEPALEEGEAVYADPFAEQDWEDVTVDEYSTTEYSAKTMNPTRFCRYDDDICNVKGDIVYIDRFTPEAKLPWQTFYADDFDQEEKHYHGAKLPRGRRYYKRRVA